MQASQQQYRRIRDVQLYKERRGVDLFNDDVLPVLPNWQEQMEGAPFVDSSGRYIIESDELTLEEEQQQQSEDSASQKKAVDSSQHSDQESAAEGQSLPISVNEPADDTEANIMDIN